MNEPTDQFILSAKPEVPDNTNANEVLHAAQCRAPAKLVDERLHRLYAMGHMDRNASGWCVLDGFCNRLKSLFESFDAFTLVGKQRLKIQWIRHFGARKSFAERIDSGSRQSHRLAVLQPVGTAVGLCYHADAVY